MQLLFLNVFRVIEKLGRQGLGCDVQSARQSSKAFFLGRISLPSHMETNGLSPNPIQSICFRVIWRGGGGWGVKAREACSVYLGIVLVCSLGRVKGAAFLEHHESPFCIQSVQGVAEEEVRANRECGAWSRGDCSRVLSSGLDTKCRLEGEHREDFHVWSRQEQKGEQEG